MRIAWAERGGRWSWGNSGPAASRHEAFCPLHSSLSMVPSVTDTLNVATDNRPSVLVSATVHMYLPSFLQYTPASRHEAFYPRHSSLQAWGLLSLTLEPLGMRPFVLDAPASRHDALNPRHSSLQECGLPRYSNLSAWGLLSLEPLSFRHEAFFICYSSLKTWDHMFLSFQPQCTMPSIPPSWGLP